MRIKRILSGVLAFSVIVSALSGCDESKKENNYGLNPNVPVTITIWHYYNGVQQTGFDNMVKEFNDTVGIKKGIIVQAFSKGGVSELAGSVTAALNDEFGAEKPPDIFGCYADNSYVVNQMGKLADISKYFTDEELAEYVDGYIAEGRYDEGTLKIFPTAKSTEIMILNVTDWEPFAAAEGVTFDDLKTWESLAEVAEKYYNYTDSLTPDVPNDGKAFFGRDAAENYLLIGAKQLGSPLVTDSDPIEPSIDKATVKRLWESFYVPFVKGYYTAEGRFRSDDVKLGKVIALICSTTGAAYYPDKVTRSDETEYPIENMLLPVPNFEGTEPYVVQQGAGMSVIKSDEKTEYACTVFLKWFADTERNMAFAAGSGYLPVKKAANSAAELDNVIANNGLSIGNTMYNTLVEAMEEVNGYNLYVAKPFDKSAEYREALKNYINNTCAEDSAEVKKMLERGADRAAALEEYCSDTAFEKWFDGLEKAVQAAIN